MKKIILFLVLIFLFSFVSAEENFYYDNSGAIQANSNWSAGVISDTLLNNYYSSVSALSFQSNPKEKYYFDSGKTILENVPVGRTYRIINGNEYSPYWIGIKNARSSFIGTSVEAAKISIGTVSKPSYFWFMESKEFPFIEYDCGTGLFSNASIELTASNRTASCSIVDVELVSVNSDNTVSLAITYNETDTLKEIPLAKSLGNGKYSFETENLDPKTPVLYKLEGLPLFVYFFGLDSFDKTTPVLEFSFVPERTSIELIISNRQILKSVIASQANTIEFSILDGYDLLKQVKTKQLYEEKEFNLKINLGLEVMDYLNEGKLTFDFYDTINAKSIYLSQNSFALLSGKVPKNSYKLKLISNSSELQDWVSDKIIVSSDTVIDLRNKINIKKQTAKIDVLIPEEVINAMDSVSVTPIVEDSTGKEVFVPFTTLRVDSEGINTWPVLFSQGEEITIKIPDSTATKAWVWSNSAENTQITVPKDTAKTIVSKPDNKFTLTVILGEDNYKVFAKENFENIIDFKALKEDNDIIVINPDIAKKDRFTVELIKGKKYNLIIKDSNSTNYYDYLKDIIYGVFGAVFPQPITENTGIIDFSENGINKFFGKSDSLLFDSPVISSETPKTSDGKQKNLQIASVDGKKIIRNPGSKVPEHIVYLDKAETKADKQFSVMLQEYDKSKKGFFSIIVFDENGTKHGEIPSTIKTLNYYPRTSVLVDFLDAKENGLTFSYESFSSSAQPRIILKNWDNSTFQFFVCQDKTGDGKCDLKGYADGKEIFGGTFVEPNYEAASIEVQMKTDSTPKDTTEIGITIECDLEVECSEDVIKDAIDEILKQIPGEIKDLRLDPIPNYPDATRVVIEIYEEQEVPLKPVEVPATIGELYICDQPPAPDSCSLIDGLDYVCDQPPYPNDLCSPTDSTDYTVKLTPEDTTIVLTPGEDKKITFKAEVTKKETVRLGKQSADCVIAMKNAEKYDSLIERYGNENHYSMDADLIRAIIQQESSFVPDAIGPDESGNESSYGLMQIHKTNLDSWMDIFGLDWKTTESWADSENSIWAGTRYFNSTEAGDNSLEKEINGLNCNEEELNKVLVNSGIAKATWKTALKIAGYNSGPKNVSCTEIKATSTRETYVPSVIAWYRIFKENYGKEIELGNDYCKPTKVSDTTVIESKPLIETPEACKTCSNVIQCLSCIDYKFVTGVFEVEN